MPEEEQGQEPDTQQEQPEGQEPEGTPEEDSQPNAVDELPDWAQDEIRSLRDEAASRRTENKNLRSEFDTLKGGLAKALGLEEDEEPDPDRLSDEVEQWKGKYRQERLRNLVQVAATEQSAHPELVWALLSDKGAFNEVDLEADDLESSIQERVQEALTKHPQLKVSSGSADQGPRGSQPQTDDIDSLIRTAVTGR